MLRACARVSGEAAHGVGAVVGLEAFVVQRHCLYHDAVITSVKVVVLQCTWPAVVDLPGESGRLIAVWIAL
jgi:hypothetical protein